MLDISRRHLSQISGGHFLPPSDEPAQIATPPQESSPVLFAAVSPVAVLPVKVEALNAILTNSKGARVPYFITYLRPNVADLSWPPPAGEGSIFHGPTD